MTLKGDINKLSSTIEQTNEENRVVREALLAIVTMLVAKLQITQRLRFTVTFYVELDEAKEKPQ